MARVWREWRQGKGLEVLGKGKDRAEGSPCLWAGFDSIWWGAREIHIPIPYLQQWRSLVRPCSSCLELLALNCISNSFRLVQLLRTYIYGSVGRTGKESLCTITTRCSLLFLKTLSALNRSRTRMDRLLDD